MTDKHSTVTVGAVLFHDCLALSLPLAAVYYPGNFTALVKQIISHPRKLKSAHVDYFMQALSLGFVYMLEFVRHDAFPMFVVIPMIFESA